MTREKESKLLTIVQWILEETDEPVDELEYLIKKAYPNQTWLNEYSDVINYMEREVSDESSLSHKNSRSNSYE